MSNDSTRSFWTGLGAILGGLATLIGAVTGLVVVMRPDSSADGGHSVVAVTTSDGGAATTTTSASPTSPGPSSPAPTSTESTTIPPVAPTTAPADLPFVFLSSASASATRPNGNDGCGNRTDYQAANVLDQRRETAWMAPGDGTGAVMEISLNVTGPVMEVGLIPGYDKVDPCSGAHRFAELRRVRRVRWEFDNGITIEQVLEDRAEYQVVELPRTVMTQRIRVVILETLPPGNPLLDHTPISEIGVG